MISKLLSLFTNDGVLSQVIDDFPYPIAIFTPRYTLAMVNKAFTEATKIEADNLESIRILQYMVEDARLATAITKVFDGDTFYLEDLKNPFSMFQGGTQEVAPQSAHFNNAVVFPVIVDDGEITHGVIVFMP